MVYYRSDIVLVGVHVIGVYTNDNLFRLCDQIFFFNNSILGGGYAGTALCYKISDWRCLYSVIMGEKSFMASRDGEIEQ